MQSSRAFTDLHPTVRALAVKHVEECKKAGIEILVTSTYRDFEAQDALYAQGRTTPGAIVTNARGGESYHNFRVAYDVVPIRNGKCVWDVSDPAWHTVGAIGKSIGLEWAGDWVKFKEYPHFQYTSGLTLADLRAGKQIPYASV